MRGDRLSMFDLFSVDDYEEAREAKLITAREDGAGLSILNYSDSAIYTPGSWDNPAVRQCRGLIVDEVRNVIARPWAKFFNHGQIEAGELDLNAPVEVTDKMDGSLGIIHVTSGGQQRVASRGSFESDQAIHATAVLHARYPSLMSVGIITPLVEIIYPSNRIVVDYGDLDDLVLLGGVDIETGDYIGPAATATIIGWSGPRAEVFNYATLRDALAAEPRPGKEGFCVRYRNENRIVKIKQEDYVRLHRIVTGLSERTVWEHMSEGRTMASLLGPLPDELHQWTRGVWARIDLEAMDVEDRARMAHHQILESLPTGWSRGDYAEQAKRKGSLTPLLFNLLDNRDPRPAILRNLKPAGDLRAKSFSEATA
jgi:RNA ligase